MIKRKPTSIYQSLSNPPLNGIFNHSSNLSIDQSGNVIWPKLNCSWNGDSFRKEKLDEVIKNMLDGRRNF
jgi:hypothetical protein